MISFSEFTVFLGMDSSKMVVYVLFCKGLITLIPKYCDLGHFFLQKITIVLKKCSKSQYFLCYNLKMMVNPPNIKFINS